MMIGKQTMKNSEKGFTLVELAVGLAVLGICAAFTVRPIVSVFEVAVSTSEVRELWDQGSVALRRMAAEIKEAEQITLVGESEVRVFKAHTLADGNYEVAFYLQGHMLYRRGEPGGNAAILAQNVETFEVTYAGVLSLSIELTAPGGGRYQIETDAYPMNLQAVESKSFYNENEQAGDWQLVIDGG